MDFTLYLNRCHHVCSTKAGHDQGAMDWNKYGVKKSCDPACRRMNVKVCGMGIV